MEPTRPPFGRSSRRGARLIRSVIPTRPEDLQIISHQGCGSRVFAVASRCFATLEDVRRRGAFRCFDLGRGNRRRRNRVGLLWALGLRSIMSPWASKRLALASSGGPSAPWSVPSAPIGRECFSLRWGFATRLGHTHRLWGMFPRRCSRGLSGRSGVYSTGGITSRWSRRTPHGIAQRAAVVRRSRLTATVSQARS